jgi:hypothetical protein
VPKKDDAQGFTARDVQEMAGLTNRQLNDWDGRGALPHTREGTGWRRFSRRQLFILMVCTELRRKFGVSVERLKFVTEFMNQEGADHFDAAVRMMATFGAAVWLMTDFEDWFSMDPVWEYQDLWDVGHFGGDGSASYALLKVNPIVNSILSSTMDKPVELKTGGANHDLITRYRRPPSLQEFEMLQMIRSGNYERIEATAPNGKITTITVTDRPDVAENPATLEDEHPYQTVTSTIRNGRRASVERRITVKPVSGQHGSTAK